MHSLEKIIKAEILYQLIDVKKYYIPKSAYVRKAIQNILNKEYTNKDIEIYLNYVIVFSDAQGIKYKVDKEMPNEIKKIIKKVPYDYSIKEWKQKLISYIIKEGQYKSIIKHTIQKIEPGHYTMIEYNSFFRIPKEISSMLPKTDKIIVWSLDDVIDEILKGFDKGYVLHVKNCLSGLKYSPKKKCELEKRIKILREKNNYPEKLSELINLALQRKEQKHNKEIKYFIPENHKQKEKIRPKALKVLDYNEALELGHNLPDEKSLLVIGEDGFNIYRTWREGKKISIVRVDPNEYLGGLLRFIELKASEIHRIPFNVGHFYLYTKKL